MSSAAGPMACAAFCSSHDAAAGGLCLSSLSMNRFFWMHQQESADAALEAAELLRAAGNGWERWKLSGGPT